MSTSGRNLPDPLDDDYLDALLAAVTLDDIAEAWCRYTAKDERAGASDGATRDEHWWAIEFFHSSELFKNRDLYRAALLRLVDHADSEYVIACVGAGPLEDFISDDEDDLEWLEAEARTNEKLRSALGCVWLKVSDQSFERLDRAAGRSLRRPRLGGQVHPLVRRVDEAKARLVALLGSEWSTRIVDNPTLEQRAAYAELIEATRALTEISWESLRRPSEQATHDETERGPATP